MTMVSLASDSCILLSSGAPPGPVLSSDFLWTWEGVDAVIWWRMQLEDADLMWLWVAPHHRNRGIATSLLTCSLDYFVKETVVQRLHCEVDTTNENAISLYQKLGFVQNRTRYKYYRDHTTGKTNDAYDMTLQMADHKNIKNKL